MAAPKKIMVKPKVKVMPTRNVGIGKDWYGHTTFTSGGAESKGTKAKKAVTGKSQTGAKGKAK